MSHLSSSKGKLECKYVSEKHRISNLCTAKYAFKNCTSRKWQAEILFMFQWHMVKWKFEFRLGPELVPISPLEKCFRKKKTTNVTTNILTNTPLIFLNFEKRNNLSILHAKINLGYILVRHNYLTNQLKDFNPFLANLPNLCPLKTPENLCLGNVY